MHRVQSAGRVRSGTVWYSKDNFLFYTKRKNIKHALIQTSNWLDKRLLTHMKCCCNKRTRNKRKQFTHYKKKLTLSLENKTRSKSKISKRKKKYWTLWLMCDDPTPNALWIYNRPAWGFYTASVPFQEPSSNKR